MRASDPKITWAFIVIASLFLLQCQCFIVGNMAYGLQHLLNHNKPKILKEFAPPVVRGNQVLLYKHALLNYHSGKYRLRTIVELFYHFRTPKFLSSERNQNENDKIWKKRRGYSTLFAT